jgi:hypothetical protein
MAASRSAALTTLGQSGPPTGTRAPLHRPGAEGGGSGPALRDSRRGRLPGGAPDHRAILKEPAHEGEWPVRSRQARLRAAIWLSGLSRGHAGPVLTMLSEVTSRMLVLGIPVERIRTFGDAWSDGGRGTTSCGLPAGSGRRLRTMSAGSGGITW